MEAFRDHCNRLILLDPRIKVYSVVTFRDNRDDSVRTEAVRTTLHQAEHAPLCRGGKT